MADAKKIFDKYKNHEAEVKKKEEAMTVEMERLKAELAQSGHGGGGSSDNVQQLEMTIAELKMQVCGFLCVTVCMYVCMRMCI